MKNLEQKLQHNVDVSLILFCIEEAQKESVTNTKMSKAIATLWLTKAVEKLNKLEVTESTNELYDLIIDCKFLIGIKQAA
jgi:hypothetical protein